MNQQQGWQQQNEQLGQQQGPRLGVQLSAHPTHGVVVSGVSHDTPAEHIGLRPGDQIVAVNGQHIFSNQDLVRIIHTSNPQQGPLNLEVHRNGQNLMMQAMLTPNQGNFGGQNGQSQNWNGQNQNWNGQGQERFAQNQNQNWNSQNQSWNGQNNSQGNFRERPALGITMQQDGNNRVRIISVIPGSPAQRAGLQPGDRIVSVAQQRVDDPADVINHVARSNSEQGLAMQVERNGQERTVWAHTDNSNVSQNQSQQQSNSQAQRQQRDDNQRDDQQNND